MRIYHHVRPTDSVVTTSSPRRRYNHLCVQSMFQKSKNSLSLSMSSYIKWKNHLPPDRSLISLSLSIVPNGDIRLLWVYTTKRGPMTMLLLLPLSRRWFNPFLHWIMITSNVWSLPYMQFRNDVDGTKHHCCSPALCNKNGSVMLPLLIKCGHSCHISSHIDTVRWAVSLTIAHTAYTG